MARAGEVHSIRLPTGTARELKDLTGERVSTKCRELLLAYVSRVKMEQKA